MFSLVSQKTNLLIPNIENLRWQNGLATKVEKSRKQMKERKNRAKKIRGVKKVEGLFLHFLVLFLFLCFLLLPRHLVHNPKRGLASPSKKMRSVYYFSICSVQTKAGDAAKAGKKK